MNILVCFKVMPELEMLNAEDWVFDGRFHIDTGFVKRVLNCFDESALEMALKLRDTSEDLSAPVELTALTIDGSGAEPFLKTLNALRFKRVVRIGQRDDITFKPTAVAAMVSWFVRQHTPQDVLLMGRQSGLGDSGKSPLLAAERLGWPCITQVSSVEPADEHHLKVTCQVDDGELRQIVRIPCVLGVGDAPHSYLRVPTLKDRMDHGSRPVMVISAPDIQAPEDTIKLACLEVIHPQRSGIIIQEDSPEDKARRLYSAYLEPRLDQMGSIERDEQQIHRRRNRPISPCKGKSGSLGFTAILNGCTSDVTVQARELHGFMSANDLDAGHKGKTILFYADRNRKGELLGLVPTASVRLVYLARYQPENVLEALQTLEKGNSPSLYLFPCGYAGSEMAVRWAFRKRGSSLVQVKEAAYQGRELVARKMVYSNHVLATFKLTKRPYCISPARGGYGCPPAVPGKNLQVVEYDLSHLRKDRFVKAFQWSPRSGSTDLEAAKFLLVGGRGMQNKDNTTRLKRLAHGIGADFGVSRPVAMNAWASLRRIIGVSGAITKPEICIVAGASGAAAFYAGIQKSKFIIAVNRDERAPIVRAADVAVLDDYRGVLDELARLIKARHDP